MINIEQSKSTNINASAHNSPHNAKKNRSCQSFIPPPRHPNRIHRALRLKYGAANLALLQGPITAYQFEWSAVPAAPRAPPRQLSPKAFGPAPFLLNITIDCVRGSASSSLLCAHQSIIQYTHSFHLMPIYSLYVEIYEPAFANIRPTQLLFEIQRHPIRFSRVLRQCRRRVLFHAPRMPCRVTEDCRRQNECSSHLVAAGLSKSFLMLTHNITNILYFALARVDRCEVANGSGVMATTTTTKNGLWYHKNCEQ